MRIEQVDPKSLIPDPKNPRSVREPGSWKEFVSSVRLHRVQVPLIAYSTPAGLVVADGQCRRDAAVEAGLDSVPVIVLPKAPDAAELLIVQLTINCRRQDLNVVDLFEAYCQLQKLKGWTPTQLAEGLGVAAATVSRVLAMGKLSAEERELVRQGKLSPSSAYALARIPAKERSDLVGQAANGEVTRDELNRKARRNRTDSAKRIGRVCCPLAGGTVTVARSDGIDLNGLIDLLEELLRESKKLRTQGLDVSTAARVLRDRAKKRRSENGGVECHS